MILYLLKMIACSAAFYALYALLFQKEKMLVFNRFYLLGSLLLAFVIPLITFETEVPATVLYNYTEVYQPVQYVTTEQSLSNYLPYVFYAIVAIVSFVLLLRFLKNIIQLKRCAARNKFVDINGAKISLIDNAIVPHSFLNTIFLNKAEYEQGEIEAEVLAHELAHVKQKHSLDILFIELMQVFCWFNPIIYLYKRSIKVNHELLADAAVIEQYDNVHNYQHILLQRAGVNTALLMASSFNFLITKKRLIMLQKTFNKKRTTWFALTALPLIVALTFSFCNRVEKQETPVDTKIIADTDVQTAQQNASLQDSSTDVRDSSDVLLPPPPKVEKKRFALRLNYIKGLPEGPGATADEVDEYEAIIKEAKVGENRYKEITGKTDKLYPIYKKMTFEQRKKASKLPPPPPPPPPPIVEKKEFTPTKIIKDKEVKTEAKHVASPKINEGTVDINWNKPKEKIKNIGIVTPPKIVNYEENRTTKTKEKQPLVQAVPLEKK